MPISPAHLRFDATLRCRGSSPAVGPRSRACEHSVPTDAMTSERGRPRVLVVATSHT